MRPYRYLQTLQFGMLSKSCDDARMPCQHFVPGVQVCLFLELQELAEQHQRDIKRLEELIDIQQRQTSTQTAARQWAEQQLQDQAQQLLQLQRALDAKGQQLRQQAQAHTDELQVCG